MTDWALSTNLYTWAQVHQGFFGWPSHQAEAERIRSMQVGDLIVPKYAQLASWNPQVDAAPQRSYMEAIEADADALAASYEATIAGGAGAVPHILRVVGPMDDDERPGEPWARVQVEIQRLPHPLSTKDFLRLRAIPPATSAQFKGSVSPGRHVQELPAGAIAAVIAAGGTASREGSLRRYTVVRALSAEQAVDRLTAVGRTPRVGDRAFLVSSGGLLCVFECVVDGALKSISSEIPRPPTELIELLAEAKRKAIKSDYFAPTNAEAALAELQELLDGAEETLVVDDFGRWHDRYELLVSKINQAYELAQRPESEAPIEANSGGGPDTELDDDTEAAEAAALAGLTIEAVRAQLPEHLRIADDVLREIVIALRAGKHLLLGGPPGTGKSTVAEAVARAVVGSSYDVTTATADWTTFDTIGGYLPHAENGIEFYPGVVLRALRTGSWLVIDELNRADIDKAFGALFTILNGEGGSATRRATLPYHDSAGVPVGISWAAHRVGDDFTITPHWRLIGTLNLADKASLFQLSFAFLRRFAVIDVPLPSKDDYQALLDEIFQEVAEPERQNILRASLEIAFGPRQIGPAILVDVARFVAKALAPTATGRPTYEDPVQAFLAAVKLMVVSQYEGAEPSDAKKLITRLSSLWPDRPRETWDPISAALDSVALK